MTQPTQKEIVDDIYDKYRFGQTPSGTIKTTEKAVYRAIAEGIKQGRKQLAEEMIKDSDRLIPTQSNLTPMGIKIIIKEKLQKEIQ